MPGSYLITSLDEQHSCRTPDERAVVRETSIRTTELRFERVANRSFPSGDRETWREVSTRGKLFCFRRDPLPPSASMSCPVDHSAQSNPPPNAGGCPVDQKSPSKHPPSSSSADKCPVDHQSPSSPWSRFFSSKTEGSSDPPPRPRVSGNLSTERETSSIPRLEGDKWVYPSESQFFAAMARKNHDPQTKDMKVIVPIHNAVNERTWYEILKWEEGRGSDACGGLRLVSFKGKSQELSPRARFKSLLG